VLVVGLCATAFAMVVRSDPAAREEPTATVAETPTARLRDAPHDVDAEARVSDLAGKAGVVSERELVELYELWAGQPDKVWARRQIIDTLLALDDKKRGMKLVLEAVASDTTATADDDMLAYAAEKLGAYWTDDKLYDYGRDLLLVQSEEKPRVVLARSLVDHTSRLPESADPEYQKRTTLASDMVDVFYQTKDEGSREHMLKGLDDLGGRDMAKFMRDPNLDPKELASVRLHVDATERAIADLDDEFAGESDQDWDGMLGPIRELAGLDREQLEERLAQQD
jgi:hypothetical protein